MSWCSPSIPGSLHAESHLQLSVVLGMSWGGVAVCQMWPETMERGASEPKARLSAPLELDLGKSWLRLR